MPSERSYFSVELVCAATVVASGEDGRGDVSPSGGSHTSRGSSSSKGT